MEAFLLVVHITGAFGTGAAILAALGALIRKRVRSLPVAAVRIGYLGAFQLVTGSALAYATQGSLFAFCARIGLYLALVFGTEFLLFFSMAKDRVPAPWKRVAQTLAFGTSFSLVVFGAMLLR